MKLGVELETVGRRLYRLAKDGFLPFLKVPSRGTSNIIYDPETRQYVLGGREVTKTARHVGQLRSFSQITWTMRFMKELQNAKRTSTLRDVYYSSEAFNIKFKDQQQSDGVITDIEALFGVSREDLRIFPEERSSIFGDLTVEYTTPGWEGKRVCLSDNPDGVMIGPSLTNAKIVNCGADKVIAVETGGMYTRFIEEDVWSKFNAVLIHTAGQAPRSTRRLIRRLRYEVGLKTLCFTDGDPWGMHIAMVIISGSANAAHIKGLATPDASWMGVWPTDIELYDLPSDIFTDQDVKRCRELLGDPRYQNKFWRKQIKKFLKLKRKSEQQAFSRYGLSFVVDEYLPSKLEEISSQ